MPNYDISNLPSPVRDALLQLTERLVQAWASAPVEGRSGAADAPCVHGTTGRPAVRPVPSWAPLSGPGRGAGACRPGLPRTPIEIQILEMLRHLLSLAGSRRSQLADRLGIPSAQARTYALPCIPWA